MPTKLRKLKITRVAVCEQGANYDVESGEGAHILLFKSGDPVVDKQESTVGDVYTDTFAGTASCTDPHCDDPQCPVHGALVRARRKKKRVSKGPIGEMGTHAEPDGDEQPPLDYQTRGQQYDLWECLWQKWQCLCATFSDVCGDWDEDNVPHLPILERSIGQFQADVHQLLVDCGVVEKATPLLATLVDVSKAGAAMAGHRRKRLQDAIAALQQLLEECTPEDYPHGIQPTPDRAGVSAADVRGMSPVMMKGALSMAETIDGVTKRAETAEAQVLALTQRAEAAEARVKELEPLVAKTTDLETTLAKMRQTPEEQEAEYWASVPEPVRKKHEADEAEKVELRKQLDDARAEREQTTYIAKAADFRGFGLVGPKHWRILKAIDTMPEEDRDELLRLMTAAGEQTRTADLFKAAGHEGRNGHTGASADGSASDQLFALTQTYADEKGVPFIKASEVIAKQHPDLFRRATEERRHASRVSTN